MQNKYSLVKKEKRKDKTGKKNNRTLQLAHLTGSTKRVNWWFMQPGEGVCERKQRLNKH